jgi:hypothetical protein
MSLPRSAAPSQASFLSVVLLSASVSGFDYSLNVPRYHGILYLYLSVVLCKEHAWKRIVCAADP